MKLKQIAALARQAADAWSDDYAPSMGAALAYYTLFSIAPLLLIVLSIAGMVFGQDAARGRIFAELKDLLGEAPAHALEALLTNVSHPTQGIVATLVGAALLLLGAMSVFGELQDALDRIWRAPARPGSTGWLRLLRARLVSFAMVIGVGAMLIAALAASAVLAAVGKWSGLGSGGAIVVLQGIDAALSFGLVTVGFALIYKVVPRVRIEWRDVWIGAAVTALLFTVGKFAIGFYIGRTAFASGFGAASSLVVVLVWMYYSAQVFLLGAEFTWVYAHGFGSLRPTPKAGSLPSALQTEDGVPPMAAKDEVPAPPLKDDEPAPLKDSSMPSASGASVNDIAHPPAATLTGPAAPTEDAVRALRAGAK